MATLISKVNQDDKRTVCTTKALHGENPETETGKQPRRQQQRIVRLYQPAAALETILPPVNK